MAGSNYVVEAKVGTTDKAIDGMKVLAYQKIHNLHTRQNYRALIIARAENVNSADLLLCGLLHVSLLTIDFKQLPDKTLRFKAKLDGAVVFEKDIQPKTEDRGLESQDKAVGRDPGALMRAEIEMLKEAGEH